MSEELTFISAQIPLEMDNELRAIAAKQRTSRSEIVRLVIGEMLTRYHQVGDSALPSAPEAAQQVAQ